ncbi:MAG: ABC transporter substrate-binding protein [Deltaproteobacteria bacterium]|nr:MAG: ABC transporter substrate-binding protein [Deltaproteobacteria bacterium]
MKKLLVGFNLVAILILSSLAFAGVPLDTVQAQVNQVIDVLRDPSLKAESAEAAKKEKLRSIADTMFDFKEISRRTLGRNWKKLDPDQREEFIDLYRELLEKTYTKRILQYKDEQVVFQKENMLSERKAEIQCNVITASAEIKMHYRVILKNGEWRVYDVIVEGVSLIKNYRSQFKEILARKSPEEMLEILRKKVGKT